VPQRNDYLKKQFINEVSKWSGKDDVPKIEDFAPDCRMGLKN
jgi:hypothetical protein